MRFALTILLVEDRDRFERAAVRWVALFLIETKPRLGDAVLLLAALAD